MKKLFSLLGIALLMCALVSCGDKKEAAQTETTTPAEVEKTKTITADNITLLGPNANIFIAKEAKIALRKEDVGDRWKILLLITLTRTSESPNFVNSTKITSENISWEGLDAEGIDVQSTSVYNGESIMNLAISAPNTEVTITQCLDSYISTYEDALNSFDKITKVAVKNILFKQKDEDITSADDNYDAEDMYNKARKDAEDMYKKATEDAEDLMRSYGL